MTIAIDAAFIGTLFRLVIILSLLLGAFTVGFFIGRKEGRAGL
jgi:uncharacterized protein YneF (UPF0154 family)